MYLLIQVYASLYLYLNSIESEELDTYRHDAFWARSTMDMLVRYIFIRAFFIGLVSESTHLRARNSWAFLMQLSFLPNSEKTKWIAQSNPCNSKRIQVVFIFCSGMVLTVEFLTYCRRRVIGYGRIKYQREEPVRGAPKGVRFGGTLSTGQHGFIDTESIKVTVHICINLLLPSKVNYYIKQKGLWKKTVHEFMMYGFINCWFASLCRQLRCSDIKTLLSLIERLFFFFLILFWKVADDFYEWTRTPNDVSILTTCTTCGPP